MMTLIINNNLNIILNEETGKWITFLYECEDEIIKNLNVNTIKNKYKNYKYVKEIIKEFHIMKKNTPIKNDLLNNLNYLVLHTSDKCNLKCLYCYAEDNLCGDKNYMSAKTMIDAVKKFYIKNEQNYVLFHGREPLTNYENIIKTLKYYKKYNNISFILQTNGMILTDKIIKELKSYKVMINISMDGFDDMCNSLRINGMKKVNYSSKIVNLIKNYDNIGVILIIHQKNYKKLLKITKELVSNNINNASYNFLWPTGQNKELLKNVVNVDELLNIMKKIFDYSIDKRKRIFKFKERDLYLLYGRVVYRHINNYMCNKSPCGAGKNCVSVNYNGDIYACTIVNEQKENYMGNIYSNTKEEILSHPYELEKRDIKKISQCSSCPFKIFCGGGGCTGLIYNYSNNVNNKSLYCEYYYNMIIYMIRKSLEITKQEYLIN